MQGRVALHELLSLRRAGLSHSDLGQTQQVVDGRVGADAAFGKKIESSLVLFSSLGQRALCQVAGLGTVHGLGYAEKTTVEGVSSGRVKVVVMENGFLARGSRLLSAWGLLDTCLGLLSIEEANKSSSSGAVRSFVHYDTSISNIAKAAEEGLELLVVGGEWEVADKDCRRIVR